MENIAVIGAGSWGTALALLLTQNGHEVTLWVHREAEAEKMRETRENPSKLPGVHIPDAITITSDLAAAACGKQVLILAVPSKAVRTTAAALRPYVEDQAFVMDAAKGIEENTLYFMTDIIREELPQARAAVLSGPSHAEEVSRMQPTTCVIGAEKEEDARYLQGLFMSPVFRVYISSDLIGIELGGAMKNVIALAAGIADGMGYGDNAKAALITRGIAEIARLGIRMGGHAETFAGLTGIGDLIVTCASMHSRNRRAGILLGKGYTTEEALKEVNMVVEGVYAARSARLLEEKYGTELPIIHQVWEVLFAGKNPGVAVGELMLRDPRVESPQLPWK